MTLCDFTLLAYCMHHLNTETYHDHLHMQEHLIIIIGTYGKYSWFLVKKLAFFV